jgi:hypothetical protein
MISGIRPAAAQEDLLGRVLVICVFHKIPLVTLPISESHGKSEGQGEAHTLDGYLPERINRLAMKIVDKLEPNWKYDSNTKLPTMNSLAQDKSAKPLCPYLFPPLFSDLVISVKWRNDQAVSRLGLVMATAKADEPA